MEKITKYLSKKAYEIHKAGEEGTNLYYIKQEEAKNVFRYLRKHETHVNYRYNWDYSIMIVHH